MSEHVMMSDKVTEAVLPLFPPLFHCASVWIAATALSLSVLILSPGVSSPLFSPPRELPFSGSIFIYRCSV